ncbi:ATP-grasp domain-containing protein [Streptomyces sp. NPDC056361]|uniref:ATP-grasp domain-containing protein n=1 Tax=Streptomyces sp. NPDC056361 TaxID=3345795 RepID=UPI0035D5931E
MTLIVIGANPEVARAAETLPGDVVHVQLPGTPAMEGSVPFLTVDFRRDSDFREFVDSTLRPLAPTAVVSLTELGLEPAATATELLGCRGVSSAVVRATRDKLEMRRILERRAPHLNPAFAAGDDAEAVARLFAGHPLVVAKPVDGAGSMAIRLLERPEQLAPECRTDGTLLEQFVGGLEFSVEAFSEGGRHTVVGIAEKGTTDGFVEVSHLMPAPSLDAAGRQSVERAVAELLDAVGLTDGPSHTEVKLDGERVVVIETHNRPGGDGIAELVRLTTGFHWRRAALGWPIGEGLRREEAAAAAAAAAAKVFFTAAPGLVERVAEQPELGRGRVVDWEVSVSVGDLVQPLRSSADRLGVATLAADGTAECAAAVAELTAVQVVVTRPME